MATVPTPTSATVGQKLTAAFWNAQVATSLNYLLYGLPLTTVRQTVVQPSVANGTWTSITMDTEDADADAGHSTTTNTERYTAQTAGWYMVSGAVSFAANATGHRGARLVVNTLPQNGGTMVQAGPAASPTTVPIASKILYLNVGDYVFVQGYQTSGAALATAYAANTEQGSRMDILWVRA